MRFCLTPAQQQFRQEIRAFLRQELTPEFRKGLASRFSGGYSKEFSAKLGQRGWIGLAWPQEYGGSGLGPVEKVIFSEEMTLQEAPTAYHGTAEGQVAPALMRFGSEEQKRFYLPLITRGQCGIATGLSEPNSGSDLASLQTRAVEDGDDYVVSGTKIWTTDAHLKDYIWLATRTNPDAPKHRGISVFIVDLKAPGVRVRPIIDMAGDHHLNQVFFDDVRVPKTAMVGEKDRGWYATAAFLDFERSGINELLQFYPLLREVTELVRTLERDGQTSTRLSLVRQRLAEAATEYEVGRLLSYRVAWLQSRGEVPTNETSIAKLFGTLCNQRFIRTAMQCLGMSGQLQEDPRWAVLKGKIERAWLWSFALTIGGGTAEIQRNVIAQRGLALPRG